jgi:SAM-dependent methyltransferase
MKVRLSHSESADHGTVVAGLREFYDATAAARDRVDKSDWKRDERAACLDRLRAAETKTLLEVGAGPGHDSAYFQAEGLDVTAVDLSPSMVALTEAKGVPAYVRDVLDLALPPESFDAVYSFNALLHVPNADLPAALRSVRSVLKPGGLLFLGVFGGDDEEGFAVEDARFFSFRSDQQLLAYAREEFDLLDFHVFDGDGVRFQALTLVSPLPAGSDTA